MATISLNSENCSLLMSYGKKFPRKWKMLISQVKCRKFPSKVRNSHLLRHVTTISLGSEKCSFLKSNGDHFSQRWKTFILQVKSQQSPSIKKIYILDVLMQQFPPYVKKILIFQVKRGPLPWKVKNTNFSSQIATISPVSGNNAHFCTFCDNNFPWKLKMLISQV